MKITFNFNSYNERTVCFHALGVVLVTLLQIQLMFDIDNSQESVYRLRMPNVSLVTRGMSCNISYNDCRCALISTEHCLSHRQFKAARILPLALFVLQIFLVRELFSLDGSYASVLIYFLWIASMFIFISIFVIFYRNSCYYNYIIAGLSCTGLQLFAIFAHIAMTHN